MKIKFWGTRGSVPTPGKSTVRYGGNTPCVEVRLDKNELIILDAGTGIRNLGQDLLANEEKVDAYLLITHPHWDHIQGFPFFRPAFFPGNRLIIVGAETGKVSLQKIISDQMNKVSFPVKLAELKSTLKFRKAEEEFKVFDATVQTIFVNHPSFSIGYRINYKKKSLVYISDNEPFDGSIAKFKRTIERDIVNKYMHSRGNPNQRIFDFVRNADVLIHDTTYTPEEYPEHLGWGHSHYLFALEVADKGSVKKLVLFHHDPAHSDEMVDEIVDHCKEEMRTRNFGFECLAAAEGMVIEI